MPWCFYWSQWSPAVAWHPAQGRKLCQCWSLAGWLSAASALAGLDPCGCFHFAVLLLSTAFSLGSVQRPCSSAGPGPVLMLCPCLSQRDMSCMGEDEEHHPSCHRSSSGLLCCSGYLIFLSPSLSQKGSKVNASKMRHCPLDCWVLLLVWPSPPTLLFPPPAQWLLKERSLCWSQLWKASANLFLLWA